MRNLLCRSAPLRGQLWHLQPPLPQQSRHRNPALYCGPCLVGEGGGPSPGTWDQLTQQKKRESRIIFFVLGGFALGTGYTSAVIRCHSPPLQHLQWVALLHVHAAAIKGSQPPSRPSSLLAAAIAIQGRQPPSRSPQLSPSCQAASCTPPLPLSARSHRDEDVGRPPVGATFMYQKWVTTQLEVYIHTGSYPEVFWQGIWRDDKLMAGDSGMCRALWMGAGARRALGAVA
ncbi:hypothetical protein BJ912DRAFT_1114530 [Pholiota molesta]|nr:hypothetical protein BJ912DRAFT_1114530 [Pholiota molesta]